MIFFEDNFIFFSTDTWIVKNVSGVWWDVQMIKKPSHSVGNIHSNRNPCLNPRIWWENESVKKNSISDHDLRHNHVSVGIPSGIPFEKAFKTMNERMDSRSNCLILIIFSRKTQEKIHRRPTITGMDSGRQDFDHGDSKKNHQDFEFSWQKSQVDRLFSWAQYWSLGDKWGLYVDVRHLPRAMRSFLVVILAARGVFRPIFVHRIPLSTQK